jgi:HSP20 family protein
MTLVQWKPVRGVSTWHPVTSLAEEVISMQREIDRMFDRFSGGQSDESALAGWAPVVDILEEANQYVVRAELPGVDKNDVKITVESNHLTIRGEKKQEEEKEGRNYHRVERSYGAFYRSFTLPTTVVSSKIEASFADGVLTVSIPKVEEVKPKAIEVKVT